MMRVAYIDHTARWSGGEVALYNILTNIGEHIDPLVILAEEGDLADRLRQRDIDVRIVPLDDSIRNRGRNAVNLGAPAAAFRLLAYGRKLAPLLREEKVVCVHTNSLKSALYGTVAAKSAKLPLIWHIRDHIGPPYLKPIVAKGIRLMSRFLPNGVIANSKSTLSALELPPDKKTLVVYSAFAKAITARDTAAHSRGDDSFNVVLVGRLAEWKGQHILLEAARSFLPDQRVKFWLAGDALFGEEEYKQRLESTMREYGLANVNLLGHVDDIQGLMQRCDLLIHTSITPEPFGQVIIEGMAAGLPVIASNEGGPKETVVPHETGLLIEPGDPAKLEEAIRWMLEHPQERQQMGERGMERVKKHFVIENTVKDIVHYYKGLLAGV
ncbi:glycosyltransferase family 4 protein [Paenibacillus sp. SEL3]|jgi:glycosyltransferase involved in cell wall biosynthesis|uniref:Glycosyltransferase family 4 protein n=1 Tax=Paenibacillus polymyxa TaxID=1406 RepID=A0A8I1IJL7_PAEPO|nr:MULTISPECIES: glycosyltransferase family 4 protein [Paenibacillus]KAF6576473.1 glycosyltransferase family 4 protein [Paenibacillus sp. EKM206P]KAF6591393.1 glycosyltransferase family 4 protein [Paenibacillus sp. EKM205P]KEO80152.1 glycosyl transferase [Paenibacillus polymyxa]MBM0632084.1 glycosyltransferase family 4 protein [Paenibacillus polymyxa]MBO3283603.1 glycosyltransferase family 4 protein [Paenibacillus polymyxa]